MKIPVVNCGSSSIKYQLFDMEEETVLAKGLLEKIGEPESVLSHEANGRILKRTQDVMDHREGRQWVARFIVHLRGLGGRGCC